MSSEETRKSSETDMSCNSQNMHSESHKPADNADKSKNKSSSDSQQGTCYCGKERNLNIVELLCASCSRWFHESCIGYQLGKLVPFMTNYLFVCKNCSPTGLETFKKNQAPFPQMCLTAIANLQQESSKDGTNKLLFSKDREIIPYIDQYWEAMTTMPRRVTQSWYATVQRALLKDLQVLFSCDAGVVAGVGGGSAGSAGSGGTGALWGLHDPRLTHIRPNYDAMIRQGQLKVTDMGVATIPAAGAARARPGRRRPAGAEPAAAGGKRGRSDAPRLPAHGYPAEHPFNKDGYRYILAEPDPHAPFRQEFDESNEWSGKPIPGWLYRALCPGGVLLALHDRAPQLRVAEDRLAATGERGYCLARASHGVRAGAWYWEATVEELPDGAAARLGWARRGANLQAPLGYDKFGYSYRSRKGTAFHESRGRRYGAPYGEGDTVGFLIALPPERAATPSTYKDRPLVKFKSHLYYEDKDEAAAALARLRAARGSRVEFFKNGVSQGVAFADVWAGCYFPAVSLHRSVTVSVNFGPSFKFPPPPDVDCRPMSEKAEEAVCEQTLADLLFLVEHEGRLRLDAPV